MSRWKKDENEITTSAKRMRVWGETEKGIEYKKRSAEYAREWRKNNKDRFKATQKKAYRKARLEALQHYSGKEVPECSCCKEKQFEFLHVACD